VYCVPGSVVEAVSGAASTSIPAEALRAAGYEHHDDQNKGGNEKMEGIFESLVTRWTVRPVKAASSSSSSSSAAAVDGGGEWTEVTLSVTFQFANPALGFAVGQLADDKVTEMVEAFEGRARALYGNGNGR
jgi:coenzyme Q-binding protein COQ10